MKKKTPFLDFYYKCMETGQLTSGGLCICPEIWQEPVFIEFETSAVNDIGMNGFWGYDGKNRSVSAASNKVANTFTPLRQTIVLLCAAINNEL